jgi:hypothetical protein
VNAPVWGLIWWYIGPEFASLALLEVNSDLQQKIIMTQWQLKCVSLTVLAVLLVIGGTEINPGPSPQLEGEINQLLAHMKKQEEESKRVRELLEG